MEEVPSGRVLLELLSGLSDPRARRGLRHALAAVLAAAVAATLSGARSLAAIAEWVADLAQSDLESGQDRLRRLGLRRCPSEATLRRALGYVDADELDALLGAYFHMVTVLVDRRRVIALDGKTLRGARVSTRVRGDVAKTEAAADETTDEAANETAPHLVAALDHHSGTVLGQVAVAAKSNEIPAARDLLTVLERAGSLAGSVVTVDAMHTQTETAAQIVAAGADYVLTVKANQKSLYQACKRLPWKDIPTYSSVQAGRHGHGRRAHRAIKVTTVPAWISFAGAQQIAQIRRTVTRQGKKSVEIVYVITSADHRAAPPVTIAAWVQGHWGIENRLHWVRDVVFDEDRCQIRTGTTPRTMATLRSTAISLLRLGGATNIAAALRHHARHPDKIICLLTRPIPISHTMT